MTQDRSLAERIAYVVSRWRFLFAIAGCAALLAFAVSEVLPRRYTSTATVIIDPPATNDTRTATALNPTYLESLRTFEHFFTSDTLFQQAAQRFHLDTGSNDLETLRKKVLKVSKQHDTRILEVSATLPDPAVAKALVQFITEQSIAASRQDAIGADNDTMGNVTAELDRTRTRLDKAQAGWERAAQDDTPDSIQSAVEAGITLQSQIRRLEAEAAADAEEWQVRARDGQAGDRDYAQVQARAAAARRNDYAKREEQIAVETTANRKLLAARSGRLTAATAELEAARKASEAAQSRVRDFGALAGMRSERMRIIDPGVVPREPSSPKVLLNTLAAALLAACLGAAWLAMNVSEPKPKPAVIRSAQRTA